MEVNTDANIQELNTNNYLSNSLINPSAIILFCLVIISYFVLFFYLDNKTDEYTSETNSGDNILIIIVIAIFIILIIINAFQYFFSINIIASITGLFSETPELNIVVDQSKYTHSVVPEIKLQKQVFNIPGNNYDYENAKALCQAYGSNLATYEQVEQAYNNGAEWCNYGWSKGQMGLFPTQQKTYNNLQKISGHENDCGRPGINGGFIANPNIKFGVNCYGYKPKITPEEETLMSSTTPYPQTKKDIQFQEQVDYWKTKISEILVSPFNYNNWSRI